MKINDYSKIFSFSIIENKYVKITYNGNSELNVLISLKMIGGEILHTSKFNFRCKNHWFTPQFDYKGSVYLSFHDMDNNKHIIDWLIPNTITQGIDKQKIICIGLNKTGTTSFEKDLKSFGYVFPPTTHGTLRISADIYHNSYYSLFSALDNPAFTAYQDLPYSLPNVYKKIYEHRPNDIYVLTVRKNTDVWVNSTMKYYSWLFNPKKIEGGNEIFRYISGPELTRFSNFHIPLFQFWGINDFNNLEETLKNVYEKHNNDVIDFFNKKNNKNFMVVDVSKEGELKNLTNWLGIENEKINFSWENKTS